MILGLGVIFAVRAYVSSQTLLFHALNLSLQAVNARRVIGRRADSAFAFSRRAF